MVVRKSSLLSSYTEVGRERERIAGPLQGLRILHRSTETMSTGRKRLGLLGCGHPGYLILHGREQRSTDCLPRLSRRDSRSSLSRCKPSLHPPMNLVKPRVCPSPRKLPSSLPPTPPPRRLGQLFIGHSLKKQKKDATPMCHPP